MQRTWARGSRTLNKQKQKETLSNGFRSRGCLSLWKIPKPSEMEQSRTQGGTPKSVCGVEIYVHTMRCLTRTWGRSTITLLIMNWPSGLSDLPCGIRPPRRPSRVMVQPVAGLMGIDLWLTALGHRGCVVSSPGVAPLTCVLGRTRAHVHPGTLT